MESQITIDVMNAIERYNSEFPKLRIKQKRNKKYR